jgi:aminopeptidase-like protein
MRRNKQRNAPSTMLLEQLQQAGPARAGAEDALALMHRLYPICRSITGDGVRQTLDLVHRLAPLQRSEVPSGTPVYDWQVPREWNVREAYVADTQGRRLIDLQAHTLHLMGYSTPLRARLDRAELEPHLHSLPEQPQAIPYRTSYYRDNWGFCLRHADREKLGDGPFDVLIDSTLAPGHLSYGECVVPGQSDDEAVIYTHVCHPSLANDNLSGIALAAVLARALRQQQPRLTWRFVFAPGTIGALTWLSRNESRLPRIRAGLVIGLLGDSSPLRYKKSRRGNTLIDRAAAQVLGGTEGQRGEMLDFEPYGYDERQFCSPGFDLPFGRLTRAPNGSFAQYHTSGDDMDFVQPAALAGSLQALAQIVHAVDTNRCWKNLSPKGEPQLGRRGLYSNTGGSGPGAHEHGLLWLLNLSDGGHDLLQIAQRSGLPLEVLAQGAQALQGVGLLAPVDEATRVNS